MVSQDVRRLDGILALNSPKLTFKKVLPNTQYFFFLKDTVDDSGTFCCGTDGCNAASTYITRNYSTWTVIIALRLAFSFEY